MSATAVDSATLRARAGRPGLPTTTTRVAGLDPSITRTGVALINGVTLSVRGRSIPRDAPVDDRADRLLEIASATLRFLPADEVDLVAIEGYSLGGARGMAAAYIAELGGLLRAELRATGIELLEVPPSRLKKWATGDGRASKPAMVDAARSMGGEPTNDDEADAYLLRAYALDTLGGPL